MATEVMIDTPSPFAPISELRDFLKNAANSPNKDRPEMKAAVAKVRQYLKDSPYKDAFWKGTKT